MYTELLACCEYLILSYHLLLVKMIPVTWICVLWEQSLGSSLLSFSLEHLLMKIEKIKKLISHTFLIRPTFPTFFSLPASSFLLSSVQHNSYSWLNSMWQFWGGCECWEDAFWADIEAVFGSPGRRCMCVFLGRVLVSLLGASQRPGWRRDFPCLCGLFRKLKIAKSRSASVSAHCLEEAALSEAIERCDAFSTGKSSGFSTYWSGMEWGKEGKLN